MDFLERAKSERERLLKKLRAVEEAIKILDPAYGENWEDNVPDWALGAAELGLTDSVRLLLQSNPNQPISPTEVRDLLVANHYDFGKQPNPLASIHTVLKRITNGSDSRFQAIPADKGSLYKFVPGLKDLAGALAQPQQIANEVALRMRSGEKFRLPPPPGMVPELPPPPGYKQKKESK